MLIDTEQTADTTEMQLVGGKCNYSSNKILAIEKTKGFNPGFSYCRRKVKTIIFIENINRFINRLISSLDILD